LDERIRVEILGAKRHPDMISHGVADAHNRPQTLGAAVHNVNWMTMAWETPIADVSDVRYVRAISHPVRLRLLAALEKEPASPKMLAERLSIPLGTIAYHVRTLNGLGLLELVDTKQRRGAVEHYYRAKERPRFSDQAWAELDVVAKRRVVTAALSEAHAHAFSAASSDGFERPDAHFTRTPLRLDEAGWTKLAAASKRWLAEAREIQDESRERIEQRDEALGAELVILLFEALSDPVEPESGHNAGNGSRQTATAAKA
jgi:DNA-binding transcriptional ArsR family regulator